MSVRSMMVRQVRKVLKKTYKLDFVSLDMIKGVPDIELEENYAEYLDLVIDDTLYCAANYSDFIGDDEC